MSENLLPTSKKDILTVTQICRLVFSQPSYLILTVLYVPIVMLLFVIPSNFLSLTNLILSNNIPVLTRIQILIEFIPLFGKAGYGFVQIFLLHVAAVIISVNLSLFTYHLCNQDLSLKRGLEAGSGTVFGVLGASCASCTSTLLPSLLSLIGLSGALSVFPLDGAEFLIAAIIIALLSVYWTAISIRTSRDSD